MTNTDDIVTFRLTDCSDPETFTKAATAMEPDLKDICSKIRRDPTIDNTWLWGANILWTSPEAAKATAARMRHAALHLQQECHAPHRPPL